MADFGVNATQLSDPQGQGTAPLSPVQERVTNLGISPVFEAATDMFAKALKNSAKDAAEARKNAVIGEYQNNQSVYSDAMITGQWNAGQTSTASRANFQKFIAAYPEYMKELVEARSASYIGTEIGEAEKKADAAFKLLEKEKADAAGKGYTFYPNQSQAAVDANLEAFRTGVRVDEETRKRMALSAEQRAENTEGRSEYKFRQDIQDYQIKEEAAKGLVTIADKNFDAFLATGKDLMLKVQTGMPQEVAMVEHNKGVARIRAAIAAVSARNPELAGPWERLFTEMDTNIREQLDPKKKSASELQLLKDRYETLITTQKLLAVEGDKDLRQAVVATELFKGDPVVGLVSTPVIKRWLLSASGADPSLAPPPTVVGTKDDAALFKTAKAAIGALQSGKVSPDNRAKAEQEAVSVVNQLLTETAKVGGELNPAALKQASSFFASTEFGRMALEGRVDRQTAINAQAVFQVQYEPAVRTAIISNLSKEIAPGEPLSRSVDIQLQGGTVVMNPKITPNSGSGGFISGFIDRGMQGINKISGTAELKEAAAGLNQLVRLHAHLEGTTDYAKYWEANKHQLLPSIFPDPAILKPGQTVKAKNGKSYKYVGGNYNDIAGSYVEIPNVKSGE